MKKKNKKWLWIILGISLFGIMITMFLLPSVEQSIISVAGEIRPIENYSENVNGIPLLIETEYKGTLVSETRLPTATCSICGENDGKTTISNDYNIVGNQITLSSSMSITRNICNGNFISIKFTAPYDLTLSGNYDLKARADDTLDDKIQFEVTGLPTIEAWADDSISGIGPRPIDQLTANFEKNYSTGEEIIVKLITNAGKGSTTGEVTFTLNKIEPIVINLCGNDICDTDESITSCPADCKESPFNWLLWILIGIGLIIIVFIVILTLKKRH